MRLLKVKFKNCIQCCSDCENVIMPRIADKIKGKEREFCPRCQCKFENRNTSIIKFVVILVIWVISLLVVYMLFLICLDPLLNKRVKANYQEHTNEEVRIHCHFYHSQNKQKTFFHNLIGRRHIERCSRPICTSDGCS